MESNPKVIEFEKNVLESKLLSLKIEKFMFKPPPKEPPNKT